MKPSIIYTLGKGHSGSTIFNLVLGQHPNILALGEVTTTFKNLKNTKNICTCGKSKYECPIWSKALELNEELSLTDKYKQLINIVNNYSQDEIIIADSSKNLKPLIDLYQGIERQQLFVTFIIKDIRNFVTSRIYRKKLHNKHSKLFLFDIIRLSISWYKQNIKMKKFLNSKELNNIQFGYEEFALNQDIILKELTNRLSIEWDDKHFQLSNNAETHMLHGNAMRHDKDKNKEVTYDYRWFYFKELQKNYLFLLPFLRWNRKNVYNHKDDAYKYNEPQKYRSTV